MIGFLSPRGFRSWRKTLLSLTFCFCPAALWAGDFEVTLPSEPSEAASGWEFNVGLHLWGPDLSGASSTGTGIQLGVRDIIDDLQIAFMGSFLARKDRWFLGTDAIYMELQDSAFGSLGPAATRVSVDLKSWILTPAVGYSLFKGEKGTFDVLLGGRYLYLAVDAVGTVSLPPLGSVNVPTSDSGSEWAAVVGFKGHYNFSEKWFLPYYFDIGSGEPDLTIQAFLGVGYRTPRFEVTLGYRYLKFDLEASSPLSKLEAKGPMMAIHYSF